MGNCKQCRADADEMQCEKCGGIADIRYVEGVLVGRCRDNACAHFTVVR